MADKQTKRGSKPKDTKSLPPPPSKRWFDGWQYTVHAVANDSGRQVRVYYFPNLPEGQQKVVQFQLYGEPLDPLRLVANLLESALYELTKVTDLPTTDRKANKDVVHAPSSPPEKNKL